MKPLRVIRPDDRRAWDSDHAQAFNVNKVATDQIADALIDLDRRPEEYLRFPWHALDELVGGIPKGEVWFLAGFSSQGKTTFLASAIDAWFEQGKRIYWMGLESRGKTLRTHWACKRLGIDAGQVLTGELKTAPNWQAIRDAIRAEILSQGHGAKLERVYIAPVASMDLRALNRAEDEAHDFRADLSVIDHIDHITAGNGAQLHAESVQVNHRLLELSHESDLRKLVATQCNNEVVRGNPLLKYAPPQPHHVYMGSHKRMIAAGMIGINKSMKIGGVEKEMLRQFREGQLEEPDILEHGIMVASLMKHRNFGTREGRRALLEVERGRVRDLSLERARDLDARRHAIKTNRDITPYGGKA